MPTIKATSLRLPQATVMISSKPREHFLVGADGCEGIEIRDNGTAVIQVAGKPPLYVLPSGALALGEEPKK